MERVSGPSSKVEWSVWGLHTRVLEVQRWKRCSSNLLGCVGHSAHEVLLNGFKDLPIDGRSFAVVERAGFASKHTSAPKSRL